jgi:hypothetical protein
MTLHGLRPNSPAARYQAPTLCDLRGPRRLSLALRPKEYPIDGMKWALCFKWIDLGPLISGKSQIMCSSAGKTLTQYWGLMQINGFCSFRWQLGRMENESADELASRCTILLLQKSSFPTIWVRVLKSHRLVEGIPRQKLYQGRSVLEISLITGQLLVFDGDAGNFWLR